MLGHDSLANTEAEAGAFPNRLGRKERIEKAALVFSRDARAIIFEQNPDRSGFDLGPDRQTSASIRREHGLFRIDDQVEEDLCSLMRIAHRQRQIRFRRKPQLDVADLHFIAT